MSIAKTVEAACERQHCDYDIWVHEHTRHSMASARCAHIPASHLAKAVVLRDQEGPVLAVIPADRSVNTGRVNELMNRYLFLMGEKELAGFFPDCETGAIPATGLAYDMRTITDASLLGAEDVWFEGGDHESLVHMTGDMFRRLMQDTLADTISSKV